MGHKQLNTTAVDKVPNCTSKEKQKIQMDTKTNKKFQPITNKIDVFLFVFGNSQPKTYKVEGFIVHQFTCKTKNNYREIIYLHIFFFFFTKECERAR